MFSFRKVINYSIKLGGIIEFIKVYNALHDYKKGKCGASTALVKVKLKTLKKDIYS